MRTSSAFLALVCLFLSGQSLHLRAEKTSAAERLQALIDSITAITSIADFKPEPERVDQDGIPLPSPHVFQRGKDEKAVHEYYTEAGSHDLGGQLVFLANLYGRVVGRLTASEPGAAEVLAKGAQIAADVDRKIGLSTGQLSTKGIQDPALRKEVQAVTDQEHCFREYHYWKRRLEDMRDNLGRAFDHKTDAAYQGKPKSVEVLLRDLEAAGAERKLVQQLVEALKRRNRLPDF